MKTSRTFGLTPFLFLTLALIGCARPRASGQVVNSSSSLVGTWRLLQYVVWDSAGKPQQVFGSTPSGYATFDAAGIAFIQVMNPAEVASFAAYYGPFSVNPSGDSLSIRVEGSNIPSYLQTNQRRPFQIRADTLVLGTKGQYRATLAKVAGH